MNSGLSHFLCRTERLVIGKRHYACCHGKHRSLLETCIPCSGTDIDEDLDCECPAYQVCSGALNRQAGQRLDLQITASRVVKTEFCSTPSAAGVTRPDPLPQKAGPTRSLGKKRIIRVLEYCNVKLSSVQSNTQGVVGTKLIDKLCEGKVITMPDIDQVYHRKLEASKEELYEACLRILTGHHIYLLQTIRQNILSSENLQSRVWM